MKTWKSALFALWVMTCWTVFAPGGSSAAVCTNGSETDCNAEGSTLNPLAAFVDSDPPAGFAQCAGFINTAQDDVGWDWEQNCLGLKNQFEIDNPGEDLELFFRLFDHDTGEILAGGRLHTPAILDLDIFFPTALNYDTADLEGDGLFDIAPINPGNVAAGGVTLYWDKEDPVVDPYAFLRTCTTSAFTDVLAASADNTMLLHVGASYSNHEREIAYAPGTKLMVCNLTGGSSLLRVAIYAKSDEPLELTVPFDIKPGDESNRINLKSKGVVPVAVLSDALFAAPDEVDMSSLTFGPTGEEAAPKKCRVEDINDDGFPDIVCHFRTQDAGFGAGDDEGTIRGTTVDGYAFSGTDYVSVTPSK